MTNSDTSATAGQPTAHSGFPGGLSGVHHVGLTVTDPERSKRWYSEVLGMVEWMQEEYPGGRTIGMMLPGSALFIGLDTHKRNSAERFAPHRTGLDHLALGVDSRAELEAWHSYLVDRGVDCSDVREFTHPGKGSLCTFSDPDGIALELIYVDPAGS
jgi:glyoxylase I family protein